jgi:hypothetical protein
MYGDDTAGQDREMGESSWANRKVTDGRRPRGHRRTAGRLFQSISPAARGKLGQLTRGGGTQYIVHDKFAMKEI